ncbi:unnamed protein product [Miscanthus lutarioriparius]|uniref:Uncharacterized protein n=1 Tax=Miscanthus lutarioriparius TaxID=422564 RepID=A0A811Q7E4_9POAL|nr:unnamed protein product [Miscanthus lutarioriparius]
MAEALIKPLKLVGLMLLAFSSAMAVSSCHRGFGAVSLLAFSFLLDLGMLFHCLRLYARTPLASPGRPEILKIAVWLLVTMLVVTFFQFLEIWFMTMHREN